jgi:hypothetical protein
MTNVIDVAFLNHAAGSTTRRAALLIVLEEERRSRLPVSAYFALTAAVLTSLLSICQKYLLRRERPTLVAWTVNAASLPLLERR